MDGVKATGYHEEVVNGADLASGVYLYKLAAGKFLDVKKMLLIK